MQNRELCLALMKADTEDDVVAVLTEAGYWDDPESWRYLGDNENNFSSIGNQQSEPIAALVEKVINGVDARLVNACAIEGVAPEGDAAPNSVREAVARFFEHREKYSDERDGYISDWSEAKVTEEGRLLTVAATGNKPANGRPSISVADQGEGQTPDSFPETFMSLMRSNKLRIQFVQGKFNMGGTGALNFCSEKYRLQLIVSRRNPALLSPARSPRDEEWGFTVVRRQSGRSGARSSVFTYLAPPMQGGDQKVLSFRSDTFPIFPDNPTAGGHGADPYVRPAPHGSLVKLYEYSWQGVKSNIVYSGGGLLRRLDVALPELALPVRLFECREYQGGTGSFATNALGLVARLNKDRAENLEPESPVTAVISLSGRRLPVRVFVFKSKDKAEDYRTHPYGVVFAVNGQMHASMSVDFFSRRAVNLGYLSDSLMVVVDCSDLAEADREDVFMNSRDRLRRSQPALRLERELEHLLHNDPTLRLLQNRRREAKTAERLQEDKPLTDVLQNILKHNPLLSKLLSSGLKLASPFPSAGAGVAGKASEFEGKKFPTYFRFRGHPSGQVLERSVHLGSKVRVAFETDADDDYFDREISPGAMQVRVVEDNMPVDFGDWTRIGPRRGVMQLWLPDFDDVAVGDELEFIVEVTDDSRLDSFTNRLRLKVMPPAQAGGGTGNRSTSGNKGEGTQGTQNQLALPPIKPVHRNEWGQHGFDELDAVGIELADSGPKRELWDFYVNVDNRYLKIAQKETKADPKVLESQFMYGMVLVGLALIEQGRSSTQETDAGDDREARTKRSVSAVTRGLAPILLPMIDALGGLSLDEAA